MKNRGSLLSGAVVRRSKLLGPATEQVKTGDVSRAAGDPLLTVVVPVFNGLDHLPRFLAALESSSLPPDKWELLVVDDGSFDGTSDWLRESGYPVIRVDDGPLGPGNARNLGAFRAKGEFVVFLDADVCLHPSALSRFVEVFSTQGDVAAVFGIYDDRPADPRFVSQYRNLYHRYVHLRGAGDSQTFWAGCGAVRSTVFRDLGGFDVERFPRPQIEDIELGYRIRQAGHRIRLDPHVQGTHLKRWTLTGIVRTDLVDRALPWMRLLLEGRRPKSLNVRASERLLASLVAFASPVLVVGVLTGSGWLIGLGSASIALNVGANAELYRWFVAVRGWRFAALAVPMNLLYYLVCVLGVLLAVIQHAFSRLVPLVRPRARDTARSKSRSTGVAIRENH